MLLRFITFTLCFGYCLLVAWGANANHFERGDMVIRARALAVLPNTSGSIVPSGGEPYISPAFIPEIDFNYFLADSISVEGIIGIIPHKAKAKGTIIGDRDAGRIYAFAPSVILKYHKELAQGIVPYVGMGMAYVKYFEDDTQDQIQYDDDFAAVAQAGVDISIDDKWYANLDVKKIWGWHWG